MTHRDRAHQPQMIHDHFAGLGWKMPGMLGHIDADDDFYFDQISQVRMPAWSIDRVALVGDAGCRVSPVAGMGGSLAIIGAARLAAAMARHREDHTAAFRGYDASLGPFVEKVKIARPPRAWRCCSHPIRQSWTREKEGCNGAL